jgi:hypothetical protein
MEFGRLPALMTADLCLLCHSAEARRQHSTEERDRAIKPSRRHGPADTAAGRAADDDVVGRSRPFVCNTWDEAIDNGGASFDAVIVGAACSAAIAPTRLRDQAAITRCVFWCSKRARFWCPHVQSLPRAGLDVPDPIFPSADNGVPRDLVWGIPWRSNVQFVGQAYCVGGKSLYWGGWCPRFQTDDLSSWPPTVSQYLTQNYPTLEEQVGVADSTDFHSGTAVQSAQDALRCLGTGEHRQRQ